MLDEFTRADIDVFYAGLKLGVRAKAKRLGTLRSFFQSSVNRDRLEKTPVSPDLKPPKGASSVVNKAPFTDDELQRIIEACDRRLPVRWTNSISSGVWTGGDLKDFIWTMIYTGLRISDVALFEMKRFVSHFVPASSSWMNLAERWFGHLDNKAIKRGLPQRR